MGVPHAGPDGLLRMSAGLGRPLVLTTLEPRRGDARPGRRPLAAGAVGRRRPGRRVVLITVGIVWLVVDAVL